MAKDGLFKPGYGTEIGKMAVQSVVNSGMDVLSFVGRAAGYLGNSITPNVQPGIDIAIELYNKGVWDYDYLYHVLRANGVALPIDGQGTVNERRWLDCVTMKRWEFGIGEALHMFRLGTLSQDGLDRILKFNGVKYKSDRDRVRDGTDLISTEQAIALNRQGDMGIGDVEKRASVAGLNDRREVENLMKISQPVGPQDANGLYLRGLITDGQRDILWRRNGIVKDVDSEHHRKAMEGIPSPGELVSMAVREVWNDDVVSRFGYDEEFDTIPEFQWFMRAAGMGGTPQPIDSPQNPYRKPPQDTTEEVLPQGQEAPLPLDSWARAYWRAHWQLISPTQSYEMLHRLRPDRMHRYREIAPDVQPFVIDDVKRLLKTADYPKPFRDRLAAISYNVITRVDLRRLYDLDVIDIEEVYQLNLDYGYTPIDARRLTEWIRKDKAKRANRKAKDREIKRTVRLLTLGIIDVPTAGQRLQRLGISKVEADSMAQSADLDLQEKEVASAIQSVRKRYIAWEITAEKSSQLLASIGLVHSALQRTIRQWSHEREAKGRRATASQIARWVVRGVMSADAAIARLTSMGYERADAMRIVRVARMDENVVKARAEKAAATTEAARRRAAEAEVKAQQLALQRGSRELAKSGTPARLEKWLCKGLIGEAEVILRLNLLGWAEGDIARFIQDAKTKKGCQDAERTERRRNARAAPEPGPLDAAPRQ